MSKFGNSYVVDIAEPDKPISMRELAPKELIAELEKGYADIKAGRVIPAKQVRENMRKRHIAHMQQL